MIKDVAFVAYAVRDVPRAVAFYRDILGLQLGDPFNENFVEFSVGSTAFAVDGDPPPRSVPGNCSGINFEVDDIAAAHKHLLDNNVEVSQIYEFPTCSICMAKDPDGNSFILHERKKM